MAERFRASCSACGYESAARPAQGVAVLVTDAEEDTRRRTEDVPLVFHPLAPFVLDEFGLSYPAAAWGGQLVLVRAVVCPDCGSSHEHRYLTAGGASAGCAGWLVVGLFGAFVALVSGLLVGNPFLGAALGGGVAVGLLATAELGASVIVRSLYPRRARAVEGANACPNCGSRGGVRVSALPAKLPCPQCGEARLMVARN